tara:strand:- start:2051 stop:2257 length:207 start_codon:yes stop_codon:yes gene_type:complete
MIEILIISIGLVLVIEGSMYFLFADKIDFLLNILKNYNSKIIRNISLIIILFGLCLIYFTFKYYGEIK